MNFFSCKEKMVELRIFYKVISWMYIIPRNVVGTIFSKLPVHKDTMFKALNS